MKVLYYDVFTGISGDMNLGALVDLGVDFDYLVNELKKLKINDEFKLVKRQGVKHGITGTKVDVMLTHGDTHDHKHEEGHSHGDYDHKHEEGHSHRDHDHKHEEGHSHSDHDHKHEEGHSHSNHDHKHEEGHSHSDHDHKHEEGHSHGNHDHRNFSMIKQMIQASDFNENVKTLSIHMFKLVAEAEGKVHGKPLDQVHFHEVGATDSIVDIVGAAICLDALKVDKVMSSSIQVGGGFVKCAHGMMPVPAPATAGILKNVPLRYNIVPFETTTPTGAAILKATVDEYSDSHNLRITKIGYGLGNKDFDVPNLLRVYLCEDGQTMDIDVEQQYIVECNIDDMTGEALAYVEGLLFQAGALDVYRTPIVMKKGRTAIKLSVLLKETHRKLIIESLLKNTTSGGVRETKVTKYMMGRDFENIQIQGQAVGIKNLYLNGERIKHKAEYDDCASLAQRLDLPINKVYEMVEEALRSQEK